MSAEVSILTLDVRIGERLDIGSRVRVEVLKKSGQSARLRISAPREERIQRVALSGEGIKAFPSRA